MVILVVGLQEGIRPNQAFSCESRPFHADPMRALRQLQAKTGPSFRTIRHDLACSISGTRLGGPILREIVILVILALRYPISRDAFSGRSGVHQNGAIPPHWAVSFTKAHLCETRFVIYCAFIVQCPIKTSTKEFCDTITTSIAPCEKYRCWASKLNKQKANALTAGLQAPLMWCTLLCAVRSSP